MGNGVTEATVRRDLMRQLQIQLPAATLIRYEDRFSKGIPDLSVSYNGKTSFWEIKYADPDCSTSNVQHYLCTRLAHSGFHCRYLIFQRGIARPTHPRPRQIRVVKPENFEQWERLGLVLCEGRFDFSAVGCHLLTVHR